MTQVFKEANMAVSRLNTFMLVVHFEQETRLV